MPTETLTIDPTAAPLELATGTDGFYLRGFSSPTPARKNVLASSQDTEGTILVDSEYDARTITALVRASSTSSRSAWYAKLDKLQQKIAKINETGGVLKRVLLGASTAGYYDLIGDSQANVEWDIVRYGKMGDIDIELSFLAKPFIRGDEIALSVHSEIYLPCLIFTELNIKGDVTGLGRLQIRNDASVDQLVAWWGLQCRNYDSATTAALFYEAESLTPLDQAVKYTITGASGGGQNTVRHPGPSTSTWSPILSTDIFGSGKLTHKGVYRVLARVYTTFTGAKPQIRFLYGQGDLTKTITNDTVTVQTSATFFVHDFGLVRLDSSQWGGAFQAKVGTAGDTVAIDCLMLVPVDEGYGFAKAIQPPSNLVGTTAIRSASAVAIDNVTLPGLTWTNATNAAVEDGVFASCNLGGEAQHSTPASVVGGYPTHTGYSSPYAWVNLSGVSDGSGGQYASTPVMNYSISSQAFLASSYGFAIPASATITGIKIIGTVYTTAPDPSNTHFTVQLSKSGARVGTWHDVGPIPYSWSNQVWGSSTDLWGTTWTPTEINAAGFGVFMDTVSSHIGQFWEAVDYLQVIVYYTVETYYLKVTGFGFTLGAGSVIAGIGVSIKGYNSGTYKSVYQSRVRIIKGGTIQSTEKANGQTLAASNSWNSYGGDNDLWGTTWTPTDINSAGFGVAFTCQVVGSNGDGSGSGAAIANIDAVRITVYYSTSGGFITTSDAVIFGNGRWMEVNDHEVVRQNLSGTFPVSVAYYSGSYLRIPPARQENRAIRVFAKATRSGDPPNVADSGIDDITGQLFYTPRYLMHPDS